MKYALRRILILLFIVFSSNNINAQEWIFPNPTDGAACASCIPEGWAIVTGTTDISDLTDWIDYSHYHELGLASPVSEPSPGVSTFLSAINLEAAETSFRLSEERVLTIYFPGFGTAITGFGPAGAQPGRTTNVLVNGVSVDIPIPWDGEWHAVTYDLVVGLNTILFDASIGDDDERHAVHISIPEIQRGVCGDELIADIPVTEICIGEELTLSVSSINDGRITWSDAIENGIPFSPDMVGSYTYFAESDFEGDCRYSIEIIVHDVPDVNAGEDISICYGNEAILTAAGADTYVWSPEIEDGIAFSPVFSEIYTVTGTDLLGCTNTDEAMVNIMDRLPIDAGTDFSICYGESISLSGVGAGIDGDYDWSDDVVNDEGFEIFTSNVYTVIGTDINGCEGTDDILVNVNALPLANAGIDQAICEGFSVLLSGSGAGFDGTYQWSDDIIDTEPFVPIGTNIYTLTATDTNGCVGLDDMLVTVHPLPIINAGLDTEICIEKEVILNGSGAGLGGTYFWTDDVIDGVPFSPTVTKTYTLTGQDINGCINTDEINIVVNPLPKVEFYPNHFSGCVPFKIDFNNEFSGASYHWNFGDGSISTLENPSHIYESIGLFDVSLTITSESGCKATNSFIDYIEVIEVPIANFHHEINENNGGYTSVKFTNQSVFSDTYHWNFNDGSFSNLENPEHAFNTAKGRLTFKIELISENYIGCSDTLAKDIIIEDDLIYYIPNAFTPDGDTYNANFTPIFISGIDVFDFHMSIYNRFGELIYESYNSNYGWNGTYGNQTIAASGIYIWKIEFGSSTSDKKLYAEGTVNLMK